MGFVRQSVDEFKRQAKIGLRTSWHAYRGKSNPAYVGMDFADRQKAEYAYNRNKEGGVMDVDAKLLDPATNPMAYEHAKQAMREQSAHVVSKMKNAAQDKRDRQWHDRMASEVAPAKVYGSYGYSGVLG